MGTSVTTVANLMASFGGDVSALVKSAEQTVNIMKGIEVSTSSVERTSREATARMQQHWEGVGGSIKRTTEYIVGFTLAQGGIAGFAQIFQTITNATFGLNAQLETSALQFKRQHHAGGRLGSPVGSRYRADGLLVHTVVHGPPLW
jgi:hypothetical protein